MGEKSKLGERLPSYGRGLLAGRVVGCLKTIEVPPLRQLDVNVGVGVCRNGRRSPERG